jgi:hypothetical protein
VKKILIAILILVAPTSLFAQRNPTWPSLDYIIANADQVIIGRIVEVGATARDKNGDDQQPIVFAVDETLKGESVQRLPLDHSLLLLRPQLRGEIPLSNPVNSAARSHRLLVAVRRKGGAVVQVYGIDLDGKDLSVVAADLKILTKPADVIRTAKDVVHRIPEKPKESEFFEWAPDPEFLKGTPFAIYGIIVPVDQVLQNRAEAFLHAPNDKGHQYYSAHCQAINALRHFKSDENIRLLMGLLSDSDFYVHQDAAIVLKDWGLDVVVPVQHE